MMNHPLSRRNFLGTTAAASAIAVAGPYLSAQAQTSKLRVRLPQSPEVLDPILYLTASDHDVFDCLYPGLISNKPGKEWDWELDSAASIEMVDATHVKFELRRGLTWTNGFGEVTAEDVKYSYERIANPMNKSPHRGDWISLDRVDVTSSHTGVIVLKEPFIPLFTSTLPRAAGNIVCKKAVENLENQRFGLVPPATFGPYRIKNVEHRVRYTLERNPDYPGPRAMFDEVEFITVDNANTAETAFLAGELDITQLPMTAVPRLRKALPPRTKLVAPPSLAYWWIGMQMEVGIFADKRVRQAMQYAIDAQSVVDGAFFGVAERATGIIAPGLIGHRTKNTIEKPDLDKARMLLADAGHSRGFKLEIGLRNSPEFISVGQIIAASLAQIGVEAEVVPFATGAQKALASDKSGGWKKMQMMVSRFNMAPEPSYATVWFTKEQIGEWNYERFNDPEYNALHANALSEYDAKKRHDMYVRMQDIMEESGAYIFLTHGVTPVLYRDHFNAALSPDGNHIYVSKFKPA